ncbi:MAG: transporter substrate-binding domain-containing protein [Thermodesulfobacteriota bacterium]
MKHLLKLVIVALIITVGTSGAWAGENLDRVMKNKVLKASTYPGWPPQSFLDDNGKWDGFDIAVAREIAKRLGVKIKFDTPSWDVLTAGNWHGRWDISVGSMTPTAARAKVLSFPGVYYYTPAAFVVHKDSKYKDKTELNGKRIGTTTATVYENYMKKELVIDAKGAPAFVYDVTTPPKNIISYQDSNFAFDDLRLGDGVRLDGVLSSIPTIQTAIKNGYPLRLIGTPAFHEPLSVAIDKGDQEFYDKLAAMVKEMHADGTLSALSKKWYGVDYTKAAK